MSDMDDQIREALRRRAQDVPSRAGLPAGVARRVHRRIALNAVGAGLAAAAIAVGAFAGVHALRQQSPDVVPPATSASSQPPRPTTTPSIGLCAAGSLRATASLQGAAGSRVGSIAVTETDNQTCTLQGTPTITLYDSQGRPITSGVTFGPSEPTWQANASPAPPGWPTVLLTPQSPASIRIRWSNWCPHGTPIWRLSAPGGGTVEVAGIDATSTPPCNGPGMPSTIDVGPFEPAS